MSSHSRKSSKSSSNAQVHEDKKTQALTTEHQSGQPGQVSQSKVAALDHNLQNRPPVESLLEKNILHSDPISVAGNLHKPRDDLEFAKAASVIKSHVENRPGIQEVEHIVNPAAASSSSAVPEKQYSSAAEKASIALELEKKIGHEVRPTADELYQRNILKSPINVAAGIQAAQIDLQRAQIADTLEGSLGTRPAVQELVNRNIIVDPKIAPALQSSAIALQAQFKKDDLKGGINNRMVPEDLIQRNIMKDPKIAPAIQAAHSDVEAAQKEAELNSKLGRRVSKDDLVAKGVLKDTKTAPALQAAEAQLNKLNISKRISKHIDTKPDASDLVQKNIMKTGAPNVEAAKQSIEQTRIANTLENKLENRPAPEDVASVIKPAVPNRKSKN